MPAVLQLSTVPWDVSGKCQGCNSSNEGERTVLPILHTQGSVQLDEEFNNVRMPPLSICADHPAFATWERTKWKPFCHETQLLNSHSTAGRPGPGTAGPMLTSCGKTAALQMYSPRNVIPSLPCRPLRQLQEQKVTEPSLSDFISF